MYITATLGLIVETGVVELLQEVDPQVVSHRDRSRKGTYLTGRFGICRDSDFMWPRSVLLSRLTVIN